jgi:hypothetical protein
MQSRARLITVIASGQIGQIVVADERDEPGDHRRRGRDEQVCCAVAAAAQRP